MKKYLVLLTFFASNNMLCASSTYVLGEGPEATKRLGLQHVVIAEQSLEYVEKAGISKGYVVFDINCGSDAMTIPLAHIVGTEGHVHSIDISEAQLEITKEKTLSEGLTNVTCVRGDVLNQDSLPSVLADAVYTGDLLIHLTDPLSAIQVIRSCLKPRGVAVGQESIHSKSRTDQPCDILGRYKTLGAKYAEIDKVNGDIGMYLKELYETAGFEEVTVYRTQYKLPVEQFSPVYAKGFNESREKYIAAGLISEEEAESMAHQLEKLPETHPGIHYIFEQAHVIARNPLS